MKFEDFEREIWKKGYGIAAFNHYSIKGERYTYCVVLSRDCERAFKAEEKNSEKAFDSIFEQIK